MHFIINSGTEERQDATEQNALNILDAIKEDVDLQDAIIKRDKCNDSGGWFRFIIKHKGKTLDVDIPGDDFDSVVNNGVRGRRLYVDGSSWYYDFAIGFIDLFITGEDE